MPLLNLYQAHVETLFEAAHANGPEGHKCNEMHGHTWKGEIDLEYQKQDLDAYGWGPDFGALKGIIRQFDHRNLNLFGLGVPPSAENLAEHIYDQVKDQFPWVQNLVVTIHEGGGNRIVFRKVEA